MTWNRRTGVHTSPRVTVPYVELLPSPRWDFLTEEAWLGQGWGWKGRDKGWGGGG